MDGLRACGPRTKPGIAGKAQAIVKIAEDAAHDAPEGEREPRIARGPEPEQPNRDGNGGGDAEHREVSELALSHAEEGAEIAAKLDSDMVLPQPSDLAGAQVRRRKAPGFGH